MQYVLQLSSHFHWPGGADRSTENGDRLSDSAIVLQRLCCYTSLRIRFIILCQQYSDYTCILSNAHAIFRPYIIVRKYEPFSLLIPAVKISAFYLRAYALLVPAFKMSVFYRPRERVVCTCKECKECLGLEAVRLMCPS